MVTLQQVKPLEIEAESFRIIEEEFFDRTKRQVTSFNNSEFQILRRVIHATGDFSFTDNMVFGKNGVEAGISAVRKGRNILTDVNMAAAGISRSFLKPFGGKVICRVAEDETISLARENGLTRSEAALQLAADDNIGIVAVGNAPTALLAVMDLVDKGVMDPDLIIGVPVGFVNAAESKELLSKKNYPFITSLGRKGGTPVAVAMVNAILRLIET
ncbi:MAG: precorrin-8X methylmutase [Thermodesulfobacteriota bacterium]